MGIFNYLIIFNRRWETSSGLSFILYLSIHLDWSCPHVIVTFLDLSWLWGPGQTFSFREGVTVFQSLFSWIYSLHIIWVEAQQHTSYKQPKMLSLLFVYVFQIRFKDILTAQEALFYSNHPLTDNQEIWTSWRVRDKHNNLVLYFGHLPIPNHQLALHFHTTFTNHEGWTHA